MRPKQKNYFVLDREQGKEILVTPDIAHEYRDATKFIRLRKPAPQNVKPDAEPSDRR